MTNVAVVGELREIIASAITAQSRPVKALVLGNYAMHPYLLQGMKDAPEGMGWTVTHVNSGLAIWHTRGWSDALLITQWLSEHSPLPVDESANSLSKWVKENPDKVGPMSQELARIAPRWAGHP